MNTGSSFHNCWQQFSRRVVSILWCAGFSAGMYFMTVLETFSSTGIDLVENSFSFSGLILSSGIPVLLAVLFSIYQMNRPYLMLVFLRAFTYGFSLMLIYLTFGWNISISLFLHTLAMCGSCFLVIFAGDHLCRVWSVHRTPAAISILIAVLILITLSYFLG